METFVYIRGGGGKKRDLYVKTLNLTVKWMIFECNETFFLEVIG